MAVNFPNSPTIGQQVDINGRLYEWDGSAWNAVTQLSKESVGLENVENFEIATQAEAEAGNVDNKYMTPLKTKQAIDALAPEAPVTSVNGETGDVTITPGIEGVTASSGLTGGGTSGTVTVSHADTSSQASVDNSGNSNFIKSMTFDEYGHVTGVTSAEVDIEVATLSNIGNVSISNLQNGDVLMSVSGVWVNVNQNEIPVPPITLGVEWDQDTDSLTRLDDAVGLTAGSDFDGFNHYQLRRCMVNDDLSINYYIDPDNPNLIGEVVNTGSYTTGNSADYTGGHGQVMVEIPKFWWKTDEPTSDQYQWRISDKAQAGYDVHPAFVTDGVEKDFIYMSAFEGNVSSGVLRSISGVQPTTGDYNSGTGSIDDFRTYAQNRGTGWQIQTYWGTHALQLLYLIEYADFDTQTTIGRGYVDASNGFGNESINTGATISLGNASGAASGTDGLSAISYRGVENFWGNISKFVDGLNIQYMFNNIAYVANENFASNTFSGDYTSIGNLSTSNGFVSDIKFPHFLATEVGGTSNSFLHDSYARSTSDTVARFGGRWNDGSFAGGFRWILASTASYAFRNVGSRLQIL